MSEPKTKERRIAFRKSNKRMTRKDSTSKLTDYLPESRGSREVHDRNWENSSRKVTGVGQNAPQDYPETSVPGQWSTALSRLRNAWWISLAQSRVFSEDHRGSMHELTTRRTRGMIAISPIDRVGIRSLSIRSQSWAEMEVSAYRRRCLWR